MWPDKLKVVLCIRTWTYSFKTHLTITCWLLHLVASYHMKTKKCSIHDKARYTYASCLCNVTPCTNYLRMYLTTIGLLLVCMGALYRVYVRGRTFTINNSNLWIIISVLGHFEWMNHNSHSANKTQGYFSWIKILMSLYTNYIWLVKCNLT